LHRQVLDASQVLDDLAFAVEHVNAMAKVRAAFHRHRSFPNPLPPHASQRAPPGS
jgi:hypothetical protein